MNKKAVMIYLSAIAHLPLLERWGKALELTDQLSAEMIGTHVSNAKRATYYLAIDAAARMEDQLTPGLREQLR